MFDCAARNCEALPNALMKFCESCESDPTNCPGRRFDRRNRSELVNCPAFWFIWLSMFWPLAPMFMPPPIPPPMPDEPPIRLRLPAEIDEPTERELPNALEPPIELLVRDPLVNCP